MKLRRGQARDVMSEARKIGVIAGGGMMPVEIVRSCVARGTEVYVAALQPWADEALYADVEHIAARIGEAGRIMKFFKSHGVVDLVLAGGIKRPTIKELVPDFEAIKMLAKVALKTKGDDGVLRAVIAEVEARGFRVCGVEEVMPEMLFGEGVFGRVKPSAEDMDDIRRGFEVVRALGAVDVGQAAVVQEGVVLAVEAAEGTDAMLARAAGLRKRGKAPVMIKIPKPGQDMRVDVPAIGMRTIENLAQNGIGGIAVEAGGILVIEREAVIAAADQAGVFIIGIEK
jgi:DUF1009 family protein